METPQETLRKRIDTMLRVQLYMKENEVRILNDGLHTKESFDLEYKKFVDSITEYTIAIYKLNEK